MTLSSRLISCLTAIALIGQVSSSDAEGDAAKPALLPMPQTVEWSSKTVTLDKVKLVIVPLKKAPERALRINSEINGLLAKNKVTVTDEARKSITLKLGEVTTPQHWQGQGDEAYSLIVDQRGVAITANTASGLYYGVQTLRQLMVHKGGKTTVPVCKIHDYPAFMIRGLMHDVGRNFQSIEQLKMQIDVMAMYKMNVFH